MTIFCTLRTKLTFGMEQCRPYNKGKLNEPLMYLDRRTVTKLAPAECSERLFESGGAALKRIMCTRSKSSRKDS